MNTTYRPDIDGLRAVAVLSVLAFHAFPTLLPGGFVGVDVFFVISGFLISGIILGEISAGKFTVRRFYGRRIRRIFPALALLLTAVLGFGWLALAPYEFRQLGWHTLFSAGFGENLWLWKQSGEYFDEGSAVKPLLHLWSLGVEEQYYLLWPLLLLLLQRHLFRVLWLIVIVAVLSFAANVLTIVDSPKLAFYWPHTRFWELMIGSGLAYIRFRRPALQWERGSNYAAITGACLLFAGLRLTNESDSFPGWWALLPTLGTALLISSPSAWINRLVLARQPLVYIGLISYPLYLWHWPILVYLRIVGNAEPSIEMRVFALAVSGLLAWLTYEIVEKNVRRQPSAMPYLAGALAVLGAVGVLALTNITPARSAAVAGVSTITDAFDDWGWKIGSIRQGDTDDAVMLIGDSHMQQFLPRLDRLVADHKAPLRTIIVRTMGGCVPIPGISRLSANCAPFVAKSLQIAHGPRVKTIVIAASWAGFLARNDYYRADDSTRTVIDLPHAEWVWGRFEGELSKLASEGKQIVLFLASPRGDNLDPRTMGVRHGLGFVIRAPQPISRAEMATETSSADAHIKRIANHVGATVIDPMPLLCNVNECSPVDELGRPLYKDLTHIRASVARDRIDLLDRFVFAESPRSGR